MSTAPPAAAQDPASRLRWAWSTHAPGTPAEPLARAWLGRQLGVAPQAVPLRRDERQRPRLQAPFAGHDCNWSHSGDLLLVALGEGLLVGADLERIRPRQRALVLAQRFFAPAETRWLRELPDSARELAFLRLWCAKEAVMKAYGHGLSFGLDRLRFEDTDGALRLVECDPALGEPDAWSLHEFVPAPGYLAALAWRPA